MKRSDHGARLSARVWLSLAGLGAGLMLSGSAFAHVFPKHQEPGAGASASAPKVVRIQFDGALEPAFSTLTVTDAAGKDVEAAKSSVDTAHPEVMSVSLPSLAPGKYGVHWVAVAADGHRTHGDYTFEVK